MWGPLSDVFGRFRVLMVCLIVYEALTIGCVFAKTIESLIAVRAIQGFISAATLVLVQAIISDVFPPAERGTAMGAFLGPMYISYSKFVNNHYELIFHDLIIYLIIQPNRGS